MQSLRESSEQEPLLSREQAAKELQFRRVARKDLLQFTKYRRPDFQDADYHSRISYELQLVEDDLNDRLLILLPPRHGKSELCSRNFPAKYLGKHPTRQIICTSATKDLATDFGRDVRNIIDSPEYQSLFPNVRLRIDSKAAGRFHTNHGGTYITAGIKSKIMGKGAHLGLIDDPHGDYVEAQSETNTQRVWDWFGSSFRSRLMPGGAIVVIMQRLSEHDLAGRILQSMRRKGAKQWRILELPAIQDNGGKIALEKGKALWPAWFPLPALLDLKNESDMGSNKFLAMYQQRPVKTGGRIIKEAWMNYWVTMPDKFDEIFQSWDMRFKSTENSGSFVVGQVWGRKGAKRYLLDQDRERYGFTDSVKAVLRMKLKWPQARRILIEDKANGPAVEDMLKAKISGIKMVEPEGDKEARMRSTEPEWEAGNIWLPSPTLNGYSWVYGLKERLVAFPQEPNDEGDCASQALNFFAKHNAKSTWEKLSVITS